MPLPPHPLQSPASDASISLFQSFWQGGFEGADHVNGSGTVLCLAESSGHLLRAGADYRRMRRLGMKTARESVGWRRSDTAHGLDLDHVRARAEAAQRAGVQLAWTVMHYGVPDGVDLFSDDWTGRFAEFCHHVARALAPYSNDALPLVYTPVNEISFLAWAASCTGLMHPHRGDRPQDGGALKQQLVRAAIAGSDAIRAVDPRARFMAVEPLVHVHASDVSLRTAALAEHASQYEALDWLTGKARPELGGDARYLDRVGLNYYHANQWDIGTRESLHWEGAHPCRRPLSRLLREAHLRFGVPVVLSETSHPGNGRAAWLDEVTSQVAAAQQNGVPVDGVCLYPVVERHDWEDPAHWHASALWNRHPEPTLALDGVLQLDRPYANAYRRALARLPLSPCPPELFPMQNLIVFSHLRWDFVYQRPQHLLSRMAQRWDVLFFEEPVHDLDAEPWLEIMQPQAGVVVLRPHTPLNVPGYDDAQFPLLQALLADYLQDYGITDYAAWFYTPMALPLLQGLSPQTVVYDCMDELSAFKGASPQLVAREKTLLGLADLVFTGGPALYDAKAALRPSVHCFPSCVDLAHFSKGRDDTQAATELAALPRPRLGFFGVIDERLDLALVAHLAASRPDWQIVMVGPVVKIDPASLPQAPNLHYLGQRSYGELPGLVAAWDVCLLPFALNESTRFISPTKTLEYMAGRKPVVSTAIADVARLYAAGVQIAPDHDAFLAACDAALSEDAAAKAARISAQDQLTADTSWDRTVESMTGLIEGAVRVGLGEAAQAYLAGHQVSALSTAPIECLILGAGPTGLSAAYHYGKESVLVEREATVGGWCRSVDEHGFQFDYAGHIMFSKDPYVLGLYETLLGDNLHWQDREAWVYSKGVHTRYPFQGALYGLPPKVLKECLMGAIEARYGAATGTATGAAAGAPASAAPLATPAACAANDSDGPDDCCADGVVPSAGEREGDVKDQPVRSGTVTALSSRRGPANFEEFIYQVWGKGVAKHFAVPYNTKLWTVPLSEMETSWLGGRVPMPDLEEMIEGALEPVPKAVGPNARFGYPLRGGFQALMDGFLPLLEGERIMGQAITRVSAKNRTVQLADGRRLNWQTLVSTLPLPEFVKLLGDEAPAHVRAAAEGLRHVSVRCVNLGIGREHLTDKHWIYYPEETVFHRIFVQGNASPHNNPPGGFGITCEITYAPGKPLPADGQALIQRCIDDCIKVGMFTADDPVWTASQVDMPYAYVIYDHVRAANVQAIRSWLSAHDIVLSGRYSEWEYYNSDHAFLAGKRAAEIVAESHTRRRAVAP